ncbi:MAG: hypothetical protein ACK5JN_01725 [Kluyvera sp.]|uniref:hypothetical protein n=1 Tax=Kluyvera sp. TaxID=1538228 RepID=UPI003A87439C
MRGKDDVGQLQNLAAGFFIRLLCAPALQCALDAMFTTGQWETMAPKEALDAIGKIMHRPSNQVVRWSDFLSVSQAPDKPISAFFIRCPQQAIKCGFQCPHCGDDLSDNMLLRKVIVDLSDSALRQMSRWCESISHIDSLRGFCSVFEAAKHDAASGGKLARESAVAGVDVTADD